MGDGFPSSREQRRRGRGNNGWEEGERGEGRFANRPYQRWLRRRWFVCEVMTVTAGGNEGGMTEGDGFPPPREQRRRVRGNNGGGDGMRMKEGKGGGGGVSNRPYQIWLICRWFVCEVMTVTAGGNEGGMTEGDGFPPPSSRGHSRGKRMGGGDP